MAETTRVFRGLLDDDATDYFYYWECVWMVPTEEFRWWATPSSEFPDVIQWVETYTKEPRWVYSDAHRSGRSPKLASEWLGNNYGPPTRAPSPKVSQKTKLVLRHNWGDN